ncbi:MAG: DEAD/DEAH box helicase family protein [Candidatus Omnitrophota bacterium]
MSNFTFLKVEWPELHDAASKAEALAYPDARAACFYARRALELAVAWLYRNDRALTLPYQDHLNALIHEPTFRQVVGPAVFNKARVIKELGNQAVHSTRPVQQLDALTAVRELFHFCFWLTRTYARNAKTADELVFDANLLPKISPIPPQTLTQLQTLAAQLAEKDTRLSILLSDKAALNEELKRLREEVAKTKAANAVYPDTHDYSEVETRDYFIDLLLKEAGWALDKPQDREFEVGGMPNNEGRGFVDYVLWGDDGKPLAVVEAKRTKRDARVGQQQAKLYADCLEKQFGQRPVIFYSNGYEHWLWDDANYPPRPVQGFLKKADLELLTQRRSTRRSLAGAEINPDIVERYYQTRAIRRIGEAFEKDHDRKALVVMATGAGKTRTVIALCDLLMRCNWVKRVLFLADRVALVNQTVGVFKKHLPASSPVNLVTEKNTEGRVYVSTYPTMMRLIDETRDGQKKFGVGHFDLVIIDEAHRSVYQKYRAIFDYFDSLLVGLTATPKDEVDHNTYGLFELETGVPTDVYGLEEAVNDKFLVPPKAVSVPLKFQREGIRYDQLSEEDKEQWDALEWGEDGEVPEHVEAEAVNKWLFNKDTVDKVLEHLLTRGLKVSDGDRLGKTIIFAKNHAHAEFIAERFNANYPHYKGEFARVIDFKVEYAQSLIDNFSLPDKAPHIAISVDMLDTGIDIPEVVNLVFFKLVRSKTKFWQMVGRGTRLRPDLFGPGKPKEFFYLFDYCQNLEFFSQNPETTEGSLGESLGKKLFTTRLELIGELDRKLGAPAAGAPDHVQEQMISYGDTFTEQEIRHEMVALLRGQVAAMNVDNFIVRPRRRLVEKYAKPEAWTALKSENFDELARNVAGLPSELMDEDEEAKRFDLLMLRLQLMLLRTDPFFERSRDQVRYIAGLLEEKSSIPMVREQMLLILEIQTDAYWQDVTIPILETARKRLRTLVKLIEKTKRKYVYTDFEDQMGKEAAVELSGFGAGADFERFRAKARQFLREHENHLTIHKLRWNKPLTATDLEELERIMLQAGVGTSVDLNRAKQESRGLGLFIRSLVGLDREAAKRAFDQFLSGKISTANQIEFINLIINHLTEHGVLETARLYESPFTDISPRGPEGLFTLTQVDQLVSLLSEIRQLAVA